MAAPDARPDRSDADTEPTAAPKSATEPMDQAGKRANESSFDEPKRASSKSESGDPKHASSKSEHQSDEPKRASSTEPMGGARSTSDSDAEPNRASGRARSTSDSSAEPKRASSTEPLGRAGQSRSSPSSDRPAGTGSTASVDGRRAPVVHVVGFWKRAVAAVIDLGVVIPTAMLVTFLASKISGVRLPSEKLRLLDIDLWIDLVLATDPAIVMGLVLFFAVGLTYLFVFHLLQGRTLGMRLMKMRIIDVYGDRPSPARCAARCAGYLAGVATLFLGFLWVGFDSEKRGLQDWLAGTYVIRA